MKSIIAILLCNLFILYSAGEATTDINIQKDEVTTDANIHNEIDYEIVTLQGELELSLISNNTVLDLNKSLELNFRLKNNGSIPLKVVNFKYWLMLHLHVVDSNGNYYALKDYVDGIMPFYYSNNNLIDLYPGESIVWTTYFVPYSWDVKELGEYTLSASYGYHSEQALDVTIPHWQGGVESNEIIIQIV